ncbi:MAG TPA: hypothetical protein VF209_01175 [Patescibacteria group bacterium]
MTRTQIYLPTETHRQLLQLARRKKTTLSHLIRLGAQQILADEHGAHNPQQKALAFLARPPQRALLKVSGRTAIDLIREERDDD